MNTRATLRDEAFAQLLQGEPAGVLAYSDYLQEEDEEYWKEIGGLGLDYKGVIYGESWGEATSANGRVFRAILDAVTVCGGGDRLFLTESVAYRLSRSTALRDLLYHASPRHFGGLLTQYGLPDSLYNLTLHVLCNSLLPASTALVHNSLTGCSVLITGI